MNQLPEKPEDNLNTGSTFPVNDDTDDDDIIIVSSDKKQKRRRHIPKPQEHAREVSLKFRWRTDVHKITVLSVRMYLSILYLIRLIRNYGKWLLLN